MIITSSPIYFENGCAVALGTFDGVHLGHRAVIEKAKESSLPIVVVTTQNNPHNAKRLISHSICEKQFEGLSVNTLCYLNFDNIKGLSPNKYLDFLREKFNAKVFCCGYNFRFGKGAVGTPETICDYVNRHSLSLSVAKEIEGVSSSEIRALVEKGEMEKASALLGRNYSFRGVVLEGDKRGRTISFPTINQTFDENTTLPRFGVYSAKVERKDAICNIGIRPTYKLKVPQAETHIIGFCEDLYGKDIEVELISFIREERKFNSIDELKKQIEEDIKTATK